jgi:hypothetical protein
VVCRVVAVPETDGQDLVRAGVDDPDTVNNRASGPPDKQYMPLLVHSK